MLIGPGFHVDRTNRRFVMSRGSIPMGLVRVGDYIRVQVKDGQEAELTSSEQQVVAGLESERAAGPLDA